MVKKVTSIADANKVLSMVRQGRAQPVSSLRSALLLIDDSRKTLRASMRAKDKELDMLYRIMEIQSRSPRAP